MKSLNNEDRDQLKIILEAQADVGTKFHGVIASQLFKAFKSSNDPAEKLLFGLEIFCKSMQILEDVALFCITWIEAEQSGDPLGAFLNTRTEKIFQFYKRCSLGLGDAELMIIHSLPTVEEALRAEMIQPDQKEEYQKKTAVVCESLRLIFKGFAAVYTEKPDGPIGKLRYGDVANMFFNVKHGVKILWSNRPLSQAYFSARKLKPTFVPILVGQRDPVEGSSASRGLHFGGFDLTEDFVRGLNERCFFISNSLAMLVQARLEWLENPNSPTIMRASYPELVRFLHEQLERTRIPDSERASIKERWPLIRE